ncbi:MAG: integration host factor subunit alpha [Deltaproteobacteria bacterium]|nr:integration host factor subunit alpha [Deltaproteobacteria bacterium]
MTVTKDDIVNGVMKKTKLDRNIAKNLIESLVKIVKGTLASGEDVLISGFGQFQVRHKWARMGRNPNPKEAHEISERKVVTFYPSKVFRKKMNPQSLGLASKRPMNSTELIQYAKRLMI